MLQINNKNKLFFALNLLLCVFLTNPLTISAESVVNLPAGGSSNAANSLANDKCSWSQNPGQYCLLAPLGNYIGRDGVLDMNAGGLSAYLKALFNMGIVLATGLAVIMITMGGLKYVSTDAINGKSEGKEMIQQALIGLVLALMAVLILRQINPRLLNSDFKVNGGDVNSKGIAAPDVRLQNEGPAGGAGVPSYDGGIQAIPDTNNNGIDYNRVV